MKGNLWQIIALALALALLFPAVNVAFAGSATAGNASETVSVDYQNESQLATDDVYNYTSVSVEANNQTLDEGTDYEFNESSATIRWLNTTATSSGDTATVTLQFYDHSEQTTTIATVFALLANPLVWVLVLAVVGWILITMVGGDF